MIRRTLCFALLCTQNALAYPPAPPSTIVGSVRGEFGYSLTDGQTELLLLANDEVVKRTTVSESATFGENYRLTLPLDLNPSNGVYRASAVSPSANVTYSFVAERNGARIPVVKVETSQIRLTPEAAAIVRIDFILGADIDADGLPDVWEEYQVGLFGNDPDDPLSILGAGDYDGDGLSDRGEYIAGTFALVFQDGLNFRVMKKHEDGRAELKFLAVDAKKYRIESTTDFTSWSPVAFTLKDKETLMGVFTADNTVEQSIMTEPSLGDEKVFYRLHVD